MTKKDIKALFNAIRKHENDAVRALLAGQPELVNVCAAAPPKKDAGQSPLQVAFKTGNFEMAAHLIDLGANIHFIEESEVNEWRAPVIHDALRATVFSAWDDRETDRGRYSAAIALVKRMLDAGVAPNAVDSYGNTCLLRALMDCRQLLTMDPGWPETVQDSVLNGNLREVFAVLIAAGADTHAGSSGRRSAVEFAQQPALAQLLIPAWTGKGV